VYRSSNIGTSGTSFAYNIQDIAFNILKKILNICRKKAENARNKTKNFLVVSLQYFLKTKSQNTQIWA